MPASAESSAPRRQEKRRILAQLAALSLAPLVPRHVLASTVHALPRAALIFGNSACPDLPLGNPVNDPSAVAAELEYTGFLVDLQIDAGRTAMEDSIQPKNRSWTRPLVRLGRWLARSDNAAG